MSSKKIYTSIGLDEEVLKLLDAEAGEQRRSRSSMVQMILIDHYEMCTQGRGQGVENAKQA